MPTYNMNAADLHENITYMKPKVPQKRIWFLTSSSRDDKNQMECKKTDNLTVHVYLSRPIITEPKGNSHFIWTQLFFNPDVS